MLSKHGVVPKFNFSTTLRQENLNEFEASLVYAMSSRPTEAM